MLEYCDLIQNAATNTGLDSKLIAVLVAWESAGDRVAKSYQGAVGLMQVMPRDGISANQMCINGPCFADRPTIAELEDPAFNLEYGSDFLAGLVSKYGLREALFRYGPKDVGYEGYADPLLTLYNKISQ